MTRVALLPSEPIRAKMAGIGIRYLELARRLPTHGLEVVLVTPGDPDEVPRDHLDGVDVRRFERGRLAELLADCDVAISQGQLANDLVLEMPEIPTVIDLYDPFLVENLHYLETLGLDPYRNDHATWVLQMSRGDFFLCSCDEQRQYYMGWLSALGRIHPHRVQWDGDLQKLVAVVPFGVPERLPEPERLLPERNATAEKRLLFGGLYDWYDPWPVLEALERLDEPSWHLLFIRHPNPEGTPQKLFREVEAWCRERGYWEERVRFLDWIPAARRYDLLREVDVLVATHTLSFETRLSLRTRFLDALAAGCPVVTTEGGGMSRLLRQYDAGWVVPEGDANAVATALREAVEDPARVAVRRRGGTQLLREFNWDRVLEPLVRWCESPAIDPDKEVFAFRPPTSAPADEFMFRVRRWLRRKLTSR